MDFLLWVLVAFGMTEIITLSKIFKPVREFTEEKIPFLGDMLACSMCTSFWVGGFLSLTYLSPTNNIFFDACLATACVWLLHCYTYYTALRYGV